MFGVHIIVYWQNRILPFVYKTNASFVHCWFSYHFETDSLSFLSIKRAFGILLLLLFNSWIVAQLFGTFVLLLVCHVDLAEASLIYVIQSLGRARACIALVTLIIITRILPFPILNIQHCQIFDYKPCRHSFICVLKNWKRETHFSFSTLLYRFQWYTTLNLNVVVA